MSKLVLVSLNVGENILESCWKEIFISLSPGLSVGWMDGTMHQVN